METGRNLVKWSSFINSQEKSGAGSSRKDNQPTVKAQIRPAVTISRHAGVLGHQVAESLAAYLQSRMTQNTPTWTVFDRELIETALEDHNLPKHLAEFLPEDSKSAIDDIIESAFSQQPSTETVVRQTAETALRLATLGYVIILGRGATAITAQLPHVCHVRLIGSLDRRVEHMRETEKLSEAEARAKIKKLDDGRRRYLEKYYKKNIDDCLLYDLVINTDRFSYDQSARIIGDMVLALFGSSAG